MLHIVELAFVRVHLHLVPGRNTVRHIQVIQSLHGDGDVRDTLVDQLLGALFRLVLEDHAARWIHGRCLEVGFSVATDEFTKTLSAIQNSDFTPKIHETVGGRCAGQSDPPLHIRADFTQELKTLGLVDIDLLDTVFVMARQDHLIDGIPLIVEVQCDSTHSQ